MGRRQGIVVRDQTHRRIQIPIHGQASCLEVARCDQLDPRDQMKGSTSSYVPVAEDNSFVGDPLGSADGGITSCPTCTNE